MVRRLPNLAKLDGHQCMATEVNLSDTQTELQKSSDGEDEENQEDKMKFEENVGKEKEANQNEDDENDDDDTEDDDEGSEGNESNEENKEEVVNNASSVDPEEKGNPVTQPLNSVNDEPTVKEE